MGTKYFNDYVCVDGCNIFKKDIEEMCKTMTIGDICATLGISRFRCNNILNYFNLEAVHCLNGTPRLIDYSNGVLLYWGDDNQKHSTTYDEFIEYYHTNNHTDDDTTNHFCIQTSLLKKLLNAPNKPRKLTLEHNKETCKLKYGNPNYNNMERHKQTCMERYGVDNIFRDSEFMKQKYLEKLGVDHPMKLESSLSKMKATNLQRYGVEHAIQNKDVLERSKKTCRKHFNVDYPMQSDEVKSKYNWGSIAEKIFEKKKNNNTLNTSRQEQELYIILKHVYGASNVERQYKCERYPYRCDFYVSTIDLFIELNLYFTHGLHPFNENNGDDLNKLSTWKQKSVTSDFYKNAIDVWTHRDVEKQRCAKHNNLNYKVIYTMDEYNKYIKELEEGLV